MKVHVYMATQMVRASHWEEVVRFDDTEKGCESNWGGGLVRSGGNSKTGGGL